VAATSAGDDARLTRIVRAAQRLDASLDQAPGLVLAAQCLRAATDQPGADAAGLARAVIAADPQVDVTWLNHVASATVAELGR
jgi:hypothetical protein